MYGKANTFLFLPDWVLRSNVPTEILIHPVERCGKVGLFRVESMFTRILVSLSLGVVVCAPQMTLTIWCWESAGSSSPPQPLHSSLLNKAGFHTLSHCGCTDQSCVVSQIPDPFTPNWNLHVPLIAGTLGKASMQFPFAVMWTPTVTASRAWGRRPWQAPCIWHGRSVPWCTPNSFHWLCGLMKD